LSLRNSLFLLSALIPACLHAGVVASGSFKSKDSDIQAVGSFEIMEESGKLSLVIKSDFKVSDGPDLFFAFNPLTSDKVNGGNAKTNALKIAQLKSLKGAQTYDLPADYDVSKYPSLLVHCWQYNHLYAAGTVVQAAAGTMVKGGRTRSVSRDMRLGTHRMLARSGEASYELSGRIAADPLR
jgi:hypothetical protein